ncbi:C2H2 transcription factor [Paecilomyces variotii No. 5]|uniref:C2H2 transcription factor n=1 Tax=Byssochlamys spectabilis (strain No. 5 / NBRC 109023) TaxID=1356009 RepID=V5FU85_BYSSN|nr:C2H2 transcription factor [Paecilomyces variotii No. 5]
MTSFLPVNNIPAPRDHTMDDATTPTTPRPNSSYTPRKHESSPQPQTNNSESDPQNRQNSTEDGTRSNDAAQSNSTSNKESRSPRQSTDDNAGDSDGDSGNESEHGGSGPPSKKKKGQRFFCTDFPPCSLSFTRSEHLARHIRKHTGERPFQCHCSRRFSRLDNLRQHAQTVHVNEEIPGDSLAATGTRFQRQIRTDRVRPQGRARAGTAGSQGGTHSRGHSRNLSTSSITSTTSTFSQSQDMRRRPPPLIMANDGTPRARLTLDTMGEPPTTPPAQIRGAPPGQSPGGPQYAPASAFPSAGGSPHFGSPMSSTSHASGFWDGKTAARRLSVPSGPNPFLSPHGTAYPPTYVSSLPPSHPSYPNSGVFASPPSSNYSVSREEPTLSPAEAELRRRTWHPSTYSGYPRPATSGLSQYQTPETLQPAFGSGTSGEQPPRLPGIESFDKVIPQHRPMTPPVRKPSPMQIDTTGRPQGITPGFAPNGLPTVRPPPPISGPGHRRGHVSWDMSLHRLDISDRPSPRDPPQWGQSSIPESHSTVSRTFGPYGVSRDRPDNREPGHAPEPSTPQNKRSSWYNGPPSSNAPGSQANRTSPEDSSSSEGVTTPSTSSLEYHPAIVHSNGYVEPHHPPLPVEASHAVRTNSLTARSRELFARELFADSLQACAPLPHQAPGYQTNPENRTRSEFFGTSSDNRGGMGRLEALVAVATSENKGGTKLYI